MNEWAVNEWAVNEEMVNEWSVNEVSVNEIAVNEIAVNEIAVNEIAGYMKREKKKEQVKLMAPVGGMTGRIYGQKSDQSIRMMYGKMHFYVYTHKPEEWTEAQIRNRQSLATRSLYARLLLNNEDVKAYYTEQLRNQTKYVRLDRMVGEIVGKVMAKNERVAREVETAANDWKAQSGAGKEAKQEKWEEMSMRAWHVWEAEMRNDA